MLKWALRISLALLITIVLLFSTGFVLVWKNKDAIVNAGLSAINAKMNGKLEIEGVQLAPFANFPYISIDLQGVRFTEEIDGAEHEMYHFEDIYLGFDFWKIINQQIELKSVKVKNGALDLIKHSDGELNIVKAKKMASDEVEETESTGFAFDLKKISLKGVQIFYTDSTTNNALFGLVSDLSSKIRYSESHIYLDLESNFSLDIWEDGKPTYFTNKKVHVDFELDFDQEKQQLSLLPSKMALDEAKFKVEGMLDIDDDYDMDIVFEGDKPDFNIFTAFAPPEVEAALKPYQNAGKIYFKGSVKGKAVGGQMPLVDVQFGCEKAWLLNTSINKRIQDIGFQGSFTTGEGRCLSTSELRITNFYAKPDQGDFRGNLFIKNFRNPFFKVNLHADLDLEFLGQFFQLNNLKHVKGKVLLDMNFDELVDLEFPAENLARLKSGIDSDLSIVDLQFEIPGYPFPVKQANGHAFMRSGEIIMDDLRFQIGDSDFSFTGSLSDFPALIHRQDKEIWLKLQMASNNLDLRELAGKDSNGIYRIDERIEKLELDLAFQTKAFELFNYAYLPQGEFFVDRFNATLDHFPHTFHDFHADIVITEHDFRLIDFSGMVDDTDFHFNGRLINYSKWFQEKPKGDSSLEFDLLSNYFELNDLLTYKGENFLPEDYRNEILKKLKLHGRVDMHYDNGFQSVDLYLDRLEGKMSFHPLKLEKFSGRAHYENNILLLEDFQGKMGKSDFHIDLYYDFASDSNTSKKPNKMSLQSGALDLDALMAYEQKAQQVNNHEEAFNLFTVPFPDLQVELSIGQFNYHKYWLKDFNTKLRLQKDHFVYIDTLHFKLYDGALAMKGYFNGKDPEKIYLSSQIDVQNLDIDRLLIKVDNFGTDMALNEHLHGRITGSIKSTVKMHPDLVPIIEKTEAELNLKIVEGSLVRFAPLQAASAYFKDKNLQLVRFDTLENTMQLKNGTLHIPNMQINSSLGFLQMAGSHSMDMHMDYTLRLPLRMVTQVGWRSLFGNKKQQEIDPEQIDEIISPKDGKRTNYLNIRISGTPEDFKINVGKKARQARKEEL